MSNSFKIFALSSILISSAFASTDAVKNETIARFHENPSTVMNEIPEKKPVVGDESMLDYMSSPFGNKPLGLGDIVEIKNEGRSFICRVQNGVKVCANEEAGRARIQGNDIFTNLIDSNPKVVKTLAEIEKSSLLSAELSSQPWSDDYWAIANGILGHRYAHHSGEKNHLWDQAWQKFQETPTQEIINLGLVHKLSPAEKYDLLVGDKNFTLTQSMFQEGKDYFDRSGKVESWMGICHGWAAAAYMLPRPKKVVWVKSADGSLDIPFYPADIKALGSLLYAKNQYQSNFIGGRCNEKDPKQDENGRVIDQKCFDNNPASWHFSVVNQIGINDRSLVMDATFDYEVWNQPILSYQIRYFNPQSFNYVRNLDEATIKKLFFTKDKFKSYRDPKMTKVTGIEMTVKYMVETKPRQTQMDSEFYDGIKEVTYLYDIEQDNQGNVLGGEWYSNAHPDFLWSPLKGTRVTTKTDQYISSLGTYKWSAEKVVPPTVTKFVNYASRRGSPLAIIVEGLFEASSK